MKCPRCRSETRGAERLEPNLVADRCHQCGGHWVSSFQYWRWRDTLDEPVSSPPQETIDVASDSLTQAMICPECARILRHFQVGNEVPFALDRCGHCGGMWFDANEWASLRQLGLHQDAHLIFSTTWQRENRTHETETFYRSRYESAFGGENYAELQRIRAWLESQPARDSMIRYLTDPDPYS